MEIAYARTGELVVENKHLSSETSRLTEALSESEERTQRLQEEADGLRHQQVRHRHEHHHHRQVLGVLLVMPAPLRHPSSGAGCRQDGMASSGWQLSQSLAAALCCLQHQYWASIQAMGTVYLS